MLLVVTPISPTIALAAFARFAVALAASFVCAFAAPLSGSGATKGLTGLVNSDREYADDTGRVRKSLAQVGQRRVIAERSDSRHLDA
jgi:hypothetical protein